MFKNTIRKILRPHRFKFAELFKYIKFEELQISQVLNLQETIVMNTLQIL